MLWTTTRSSISDSQRDGVRQRRSLPRFRLITLLAVSACGRKGDIPI